VVIIKKLDEPDGIIGGYSHVWIGLGNKKGMESLFLRYPEEDFNPEVY